MPFISVIIPSRRTGALPCETLQSVWAQSFTDYEILLLNDPSHHMGECGPQQVAEKVQRLVSMAVGKYVLILPDDDLLLPGALQVLADMARATHAGVIYGGKQLFRRGDFDGKDEIIKLVPAKEWTHSAFRRGNPVEGLTALVRTPLCTLDPTQIYADWDLWYRLYTRNHSAERLGTVLYAQRIHNDQLDARSPLHAEAIKRLRTKHPELAP